MLHQISLTLWPPGGSPQYSWPKHFRLPNSQLNTVLVGVQGVDNDVHNSAHFSLKLKLLAICGLCGRGSCSAFSTSAQAELPMRHWQPNCVWTKGRNLQVRMVLLMQSCAHHHLSLWSAYSGKSGVRWW